MASRVIVFGPAYLDRVLQVDGPLGRGPDDPPLDQSVDGTIGFTGGASLEVVDRAGAAVAIELPEGWSGPRGRIAISLDRWPGRGQASGGLLRGISARETLGGMGAGFASALRGRLIHALGPEGDLASETVQAMLAREGIDHRPVRIPGRAADWTLLISSGEHGDKLAIGFRGCHSSMGPADLAGPLADEGPCDLRVVAGLPNAIAAAALEAPGSPLRLFAPGLHNMTDRFCPVSAFARSIDILCCNHLEWDSLQDREEVAWKLSILVVTEGASGVWARFTTPDGEPARLSLPTFHRGHRPRDTNHAGEALAATLVATLLEAGWEARTGVVSRDLLRHALVRGSAAASLVLDRIEFGFPSGAEIDEAVRASSLD